MRGFDKHARLGVACEFFNTLSSGARPTPIANTPWWPLRDSDPTHESHGTPQITASHVSEVEAKSPRLATAGDSSPTLTAVSGTELAATDLERAIERLTRAIRTAGDDSIAELVAERRAMRLDLEERRRAAAGNVVSLVARRWSLPTQVS